MLNVRSRSLSLLILSLLTACNGVRMRPDDGGLDGGLDGDTDGGRADAPNDAGHDAGHDAGLDGGGCDASCPPGYCVDGVCRLPTDCCETGFCPPGSTCDYERTCGCVPASGCCAGEPCAGGEVCDWDCTCHSLDDCCSFGCSFPETCDFGTCGCFMDTSCGPSCTGDFFCTGGSCLPRCYFEGCADPTFVCSETEGCIPPRCTEDECLVSSEPPRSCDPGSGCVDPCEGSDWSWCESMGGHCLLGECVDDSCSGGTLACNYVVDCCGNWVCWDLASGEEPFCDPTWCSGTPRVPPRPDLCRCGTFGGTSGYCADLYGGRFIGPPPPPPPFF